MNYRELAKLFDISPSAFSLIVNNKPGVSDSTRARVIDGLCSMGYSHLIKHTNSINETKTKNIIFLVYKRDGQILDMQPFFMLLIENIEKRAQKYGYNIILTTVDHRTSMEDQLNRINSFDAEGAVIFATEMQADDINYFARYNHPFLILDNDFSFLSINTVAIDNQMGTYQAIERLASLGHKEIGYLSCVSRISSFQEREQGYTLAMSAFGMELDPQNVYRLGFTEEESYRDFKEILETSPHLPTAFVSDDDTIAIGVMRALSEKGIRVPQDISIIGYNDRPISEMSVPPLDTINVSKFSFAGEAVDALISMIHNQNDPDSQFRPKKIRIATQLAVRSSTANPRLT